MQSLIEVLDRHPLVTGWMGTLASFSSAMMTLLLQIEVVLRVATVATGFAVGLLTLAITWRRWRRGGRVERGHGALRHDDDAEAP